MSKTPLIQLREYRRRERLRADDVNALIAHARAQASPTRPWSTDDREYNIPVRGTSSPTVVIVPHGLIQPSNSTTAEESGVGVPGVLGNANGHTRGGTWPDNNAWPAMLLVNSGVVAPFDHGSGMAWAGYATSPGWVAYDDEADPVIGEEWYAEGEGSGTTGQLLKREPESTNAPRWPFVALGGHRTVPGPDGDVKVGRFIQRTQGLEAFCWSFNGGTANDDEFLNFSLAQYWNFSTPDDSRLLRANLPGRYSVSVSAVAWRDFAFYGYPSNVGTYACTLGLYRAEDGEAVEDAAFWTNTVADFLWVNNGGDHSRAVLTMHTIVPLGRGQALALRNDSGITLEFNNVHVRVNLIAPWHQSSYAPIP